MTYLVLGANGLIGQQLVAALSVSHEVKTVGRHPTSDCFWSLDAPFPVHMLEGVEVVVNLIGAPIMDKRWTLQRWVDLKYTRIESTQAVVAACQAMGDRPIHVINASAVGIYEWDVMADETGPLGHHPVAELVAQWERPLVALVSPQIETRLRLGVVVSPQGGAIPPLLALTRWGLGGTQGVGTQWVSWIHVADVVAAIQHCVQHRVTGPVNLVSPVPETNQEWMATIRHQAGIRWGMPAPAWGLRLALGERAMMVLKGHRVMPQRLLDSGYTFRFPSLGMALADVMSGSTGVV